MATVQIEKDLPAIARAAAAITCQSLNSAITAHEQAVWVLAGGTAPAHVYRELARYYHDTVDWQNVYVAMGDERCVAADQPDSNWGQAQTTLLEHLPIPETNVLPPDMTLSSEAAAEHYQQTLLRLPQKLPGIPRLDHIWLGMGEDGHTLSLFPADTGMMSPRSLVTAVHNAPKPPPDRISLTLRALQGVETCLIMVAGSAKAGITARALRGDTSLPIVQAVQTIEAAGGLVTWLLDAGSAGQA